MQCIIRDVAHFGKFQSSQAKNVYSFQHKRENGETFLIEFLETSGLRGWPVSRTTVKFFTIHYLQDPLMMHVIYCICSAVHVAILYFLNYVLKYIDEFWVLNQKLVVAKRLTRRPLLVSLHLNTKIYLEIGEWLNVTKIFQKTQR